MGGIKNSDPTRYNLKSDKESEYSSKSLCKRPISKINGYGQETPSLDICGINYTNCNNSGMSRRIRYTSMSCCNNAYKSEIDSNLNHLNDNIEYSIDEEKINCLDIDEVVEHIRELIQLECDA